MMELDIDQIRTQVIELVSFYNGCSLKNRKDELAKLISRGVDDPNQIVHVKTNCGMFVLSILAMINVPHPILTTKYVNGMAISWCRQIGLDKKALVKYDPKTIKLCRGDVMHYFTPNSNNNHVEFCLEDQVISTTLMHGGGGRPDNLISIAKSDVCWSSGRYLQEVIQLEKLCK